ncbi:MAG: phosphoribosylaminoimidazolesuccinocarboxamide synthase [Spirochaetaceae bacterium]|nr:phosphoribosylaminoimidazolesuccinocarboxamide synthase [Spirochaetaceae bacterium]
MSTGVNQEGGPDPLKLNRGTMLYEGKAKQVYAAEGREDLVIIHYKDDATAFNGAKKGQIEDKGIMNNKIASSLFDLLEKSAVPTHFVSLLNDRDMLCKKVQIVPLEVIVRNAAAGSMAKRLGLAEGTSLKTTVFELSYKNDALEDPLINDYHAVAIGISTFEEIKAIFNYAARVNEVLSAFFLKGGIRLIDFKLEFGRTAAGELVLADEISPDTCRFWDAGTNEKLDKDRFRRDLGNVREAYSEILNRVSAAAGGKEKR